MARDAPSDGRRDAPRRPRRAGAGGVKWFERDVLNAPSVQEQMFKVNISMSKMRFDVVFPAAGEEGVEGEEEGEGGGEVVSTRFTFTFWSWGSLMVRVLNCSARPSRAEARKVEELVPIRIEIEQDGHRLRETLFWNLSGVCTFRPL